MVVIVITPWGMPGELKRPSIGGIGIRSKHLTLGRQELEAHESVCDWIDIILIDKFEGSGFRDVNIE